MPSIRPSEMPSSSVGRRSSTSSCRSTCASTSCPAPCTRTGVHSSWTIGRSSPTATLDKTVVVITDITVRLARDRSEQRQRETMSIYRRLIADRPAFEEFYAEASALVDPAITTATPS